jgi:hypothetical protein
MADQKEVTELARKIFNANDPRLAGLNGTDGWNMSVKIAAEELRPKFEAEALEEAERRRAAPPEPEAVPSDDQQEMQTVGDVRAAAWQWLKPRLAVFALTVLAALGFVAWTLRPVAQVVPERYRVAAQRYDQDMARARARFEAAKACQDLRAVSDFKACEIR